MIKTRLTASRKEFLAALFLDPVFTHALVGMSMDSKYVYLPEGKFKDPAALQKLIDEEEVLIF